MRIAKVNKPKYMIIENVKQLVSVKMEKEFDDILTTIKNLGYRCDYKVLNSKNFKIPHSRSRVYIVAIRDDINSTFSFPTEKPLVLKAKDLYDYEVGQEYYLEDKHKEYYSEWRLKKKYSSLNSDVLICMNTKQGRKTNPQNFIMDEKGVRLLTENEMFAFQGFKRDYGTKLKNIGMSLRNIGHMLGNSITVTVLEYIINNLIPIKYRINLPILMM